MGKKDFPAAKLSLGFNGLLITLSGSLLIVSSLPNLFTAVGKSAPFEAYDELIRKPVLHHIFGIDFDLPWVNPLFDALALWLSLFMMVNVFIYRNEGVLLWGHIRRNYCVLAARSWWGAGLCTLSRTVLAFIGTPIACIHIALMSLRSNYTLFTSCFITLNPDEVASYLKRVGIAASALVLGATLALRYFH